MFSGLEHDPGPEAVAQPVRQVAKAAEVFGPHRLGGFDLDADVPTACSSTMSTLITVTILKELHGLFGPGELTCQQRPLRGPPDLWRAPPTCR